MPFTTLSISTSTSRSPDLSNARQFSTIESFWLEFHRLSFWLCFHLIVWLFDLLSFRSTFILIVWPSDHQTFRLWVLSIASPVDFLCSRTPNLLITTHFNRPMSRLPDISHVSPFYCLTFDRQIVTSIDLLIVSPFICLTFPSTHSPTTCPYIDWIFNGISFRWQDLMIAWTYDHHTFQCSDLESTQPMATQPFCRLPADHLIIWSLHLSTATFYFHRTMGQWDSLTFRSSYLAILTSLIAWSFNHLTSCSPDLLIASHFHRLAFLSPYLSVV